jgi:HK97 family phage prohead protease
MEKRTIAAELRAKGKSIVGRIPYMSLSEDVGFKEVLIPGCFRAAIEKAKNIHSLWSHNEAMPLGNTRAGTLQLRDTPTAREVKISPNPDVTWGKDALSAVKRGDVGGLSFGFTMDGGTEVWNGETREIHEVASLSEISPVAFPAYPESSVGDRNKNKENKNMNETMSEMKARVEREARWLETHDENGNLRGGNMTPIDTKKSNIEMGAYKPAEKPWESRGHFLLAVAAAQSPGGNHDPRLYRASRPMVDFLWIWISVTI